MRIPLGTPLVLRLNVSILENMLMYIFNGVEVLILVVLPIFEETFNSCLGQLLGPFSCPIRT